jgi:homoserine trans-succinylase
MNTIIQFFTMIGNTPLLITPILLRSLIFAFLCSSMAYAFVVVVVLLDRVCVLLTCVMPTLPHTVYTRFDDYVPRTGRGDLENFYEPFSVIRDKGLDGLIISGANLELTPDGNGTLFNSFCDIFFNIVLV